MIKRGITLILALLLMLSLSFVTAQEEFDGSIGGNDIGPPPIIEDNSCEDVTCEDGYICSNGDCLSTFEGGPYTGPIDDERDFEGKKKGDLTCLPCGNSCAPYDFVISAYCLPPTNGEPECGVKNGECITLNFEDDFEGEKAKICHTPQGNEENQNTIEVGESSLDTHLAHGDYFGECYEDEEIDVDKELGDGGSINGIDRFFDRIFKDDIGNMKERFAEIRTLIKEGKTDEARKQLKHYKKFADKLEKEVSPEEKEEAVKLSKVIKKAIHEIENNLPEEDRIKFKKEIQRKANNIGITAEIASKIKELCTSLAEIDPTEYGRICRADDAAPEWQRKLDKDLTEGQKKEAKKFGEIMSQCFKTSGQECKCEEIQYTDFANSCSKAATLATACDINGDENACDKLDKLEMPQLPDHLEDIFETIEGGSYARFENHMPPECQKAGATSPKECAIIMINTNAPPECREALLAADVQSEREGRNICDKIMMKKHAPKCAEKGITDPKECARYMDNFRSDDHRGSGGPMINFDCKKIKDKDKRLSCYDKAASHTKSFKGFNEGDYDGPCMTEGDWKAKKQECRSKFGEHAGDKPIMGDSNDGYECVIDAKCIDFGQYKDDFDDFKDKDYEIGSCGDCESSCEDRSGQRLRGTNCVSNQCECYYEPDNNDYQGEGDNDYDETPTCDGVECGETSHCESGQCVPNEYGPGEGPGEPGDYDDNGEPPQESPPDNSNEAEENTENSEPNSEEGSETTGNVILTGNAFLDYYYNN